MEAVLLFIFVLVMGKVFSKVELILPKQVIFVGIVVLSVLTYLVSLIPIALWPLIIWVRN